MCATYKKEQKKKKKKKGNLAWVMLCIEYQFQFEPEPTKLDHAGPVLKLLGSLTTLKPVSTYLLYQLE
jgi:hypothetical protein